MCVFVYVHVRACTRVCVCVHVCLVRTKLIAAFYHLAPQQNLQLIDSLNNQNPYALL